MHALVLEKVRTPLRDCVVPRPSPSASEVLVKVHACAVCRTDLHVVDGDLPHPKLPLIPGHEIVGEIVELGADVTNLHIGQRVGIPWLGWTCGKCEFCLRGEENLCDDAKFTGYTLNGGYAEFTVASADYCFPLENTYSDTHAAPLLCAGLIGFRSFRSIGGIPKRLGMYGFGASAHLIAQAAVYLGSEVYAFTRPNDVEGQQFAKSLGCKWAGSSAETPPGGLLDAAILFAPIGELVPVALRHVRKGGKVVCAGIHMTPIPSFDYDILWGERCLCSVANLTRKDAEDFLKLAPKIPIQTEVEVLPMTQANEALDRLRAGEVKKGALVLVPNWISPSVTAP